MPLDQCRGRTLIATVPAGNQRAVNLCVVASSDHIRHVSLVGRRGTAGDVKAASGATLDLQRLASPSVPDRRPLPELIAHRGMPRRHRENTLSGFLAAIAAGATGWELDVHGTRDGVIVVHHDPVLPALAGALGGVTIATLDSATLADATVGPAGERIPTLDAVLAAAGPEITTYVEVKARGVEQLVADCLSRHPDRRVAVHSFDHRIAHRVHELSPGTPVGILTDSYLVDAPHALAAAGARDFWPQREMVDAELVNAIHASGGRVIVWTVNSPDDARRLRDLGVDGLCSDVVDEIRQALLH